MWLVAGLGNPGRRYEYTRHNVGFRVIDCLSRGSEIPLSKKGFFAKWGKGLWVNEEVIIAKPQTYMNLSGESISRLIKFFRIDPAQLIVIHDDLDLDFGLIRIREKGGDGGHKGVRSIIEHVGSGEFIRVRLGIGRPDNKEDGTDYVLSRFDMNQRETLRVQMEQASEAVRTIITEGTAKAMNQFNRKQGQS